MILFCFVYKWAFFSNFLSAGDGARDGSCYLYMKKDKWWLAGSLREDWEGVAQLKCTFIDQLWLSAPLEKASHYPIDEVIISLLPSTSLQSSQTPFRIYTDVPFIFQRRLLRFISSAVPLWAIISRH